MPVICTENIFQKFRVVNNSEKESRHIEEKISRYPFTISPPLG